MNERTSRGRLPDTPAVTLDAGGFDCDDEKIADVGASWRPDGQDLEGLQKRCGCCPVAPMYAEITTDGLQRCCFEEEATTSNADADQIWISERSAADRLFFFTWPKYN